MSAYINTYEVSQAYGGAEEGGWWFETRTPLSSKRIRGACFSQASATALNKERRKLCFHTSRSKLYQSRRYGNLVKQGSSDPLQDNPREEANRFYSMFGSPSSTRGYGLLVCVENHPAEHSPKERPRYE